MDLASKGLAADNQTRICVHIFLSPSSRPIIRVLSASSIPISKCNHNIETFQDGGSQLHKHQYPHPHSSCSRIPNKRQIPKCYITVVSNRGLWKSMRYAGWSNLDVGGEKHLFISCHLVSTGERRTIRHEAPKVFAGRLEVNFDLTAPLDP